MILKDFIVGEENTVLEVMRVIDSNARGIAVVCKAGRLLAVVTDGDIRRFILNKGNLNTEVGNIANYDPKYITSNEIFDHVSYMKKHSIRALPQVDKNGTW